MASTSGKTVLDLNVSRLTTGRPFEVSPCTVKTHRANIFAKLEAESLAQQIRRYAGLVEGDC